MQKGKYKARYCREIVVYFENFAGKGIPQLSKFARSIGVTLRTLENWMDKYPKFRDACEECGAIRNEYLIDGGLCERFNPSLVKFLLEQASPRNVKVEIGGGLSLKKFEDL